jgi:hypothetical protein
MPINTDLNIAPYFDDFDVEKQFYKILFKPAYAVQARELTQLQTILQNQIEQFGDNIYQEGSIIKGCNFTNLDGLEYVKLVDKSGFDVTTFISGPDTDIISGVETEIDVVYELVGTQSGLTASVISATRGFETRPPNLNTFFINYLTTNETSGYKQFIPGENLTITRKKYNGSTLYSTETNIDNINVTLQSPATGKSFGIQASQGVIFQKGHFLFADDQTLVVSKYSNLPNDVSVGYSVTESLVTSLQDSSLYDNANGSTNENAPGGDRLKLVPKLVSQDTATADVDPAFFTLIRYQNGEAVQLRDVSQFNSIAAEMAKRTYEESGNYILDKFKVDFDRRDGELTLLVGKGIAYVKGYRVENSGKRDFSIGNIANTEIQQNQATTLDYGNYVEITSLNGTVELDYSPVQLQNASSSVIGSAFVRNITPTRCYLSGVRMAGSNSFDDVTRIVGDSGVIGIAAGSRLKDTSRAPFIFETGTKYIKSLDDITIPARDRASVSVSGGSLIVINAAIGEDFAINQDDIVVVDASNTFIPVSSWSTSNNNSILTINLAIASDPAATVYYNKRIISSTPMNKLYVEPYVKITYSSATNLYSLGFPDVHKILDIYDASGTRFTDSFKLNTNQTDQFYDISYMEYIQGRPQPANGVLTVKLGVFQINSSTGERYFTIDSYPIDDVSSTLPAGKIRSSDLDTYKGLNGTNYVLRESVDFRPYVDKDSNVNYTDTSASAAGTIVAAVGSTARTFSATDYIIPPVQSNMLSDIEYYLARIDVVTVDSFGGINLVAGVEDATPAAPRVSNDEMIVAEIFVPGYPVLSPQEAASQNRPAYAVRAKPKGTHNYTMRDIEKLEQRIEGMEYYISLNQLEQQTENMLILDENGLTRFKNGYIVDPFNDSNFANLDNPNYKAAIHFDKSILTPALNTFPLDLKYKSGSSVSIFPSTNNAEIATLSRNANVKLLGQPYATNFRNCVSNFWKYNGSAFIWPEQDMLPSVTENPTPVNIDITQVFQDLNEAFPITGVNWSGVVQDGASSTVRRGNQRTTTTTRFETGVRTSLNVNDGAVNSVGDFVTNFEFQPFMRSRDIKIYVSGLRPNTRHYFWFDKKDINAHVWPGTSATTQRDVQKNGVAGGAVNTDGNGILTAVFTIPEGTFYVGDRLLQIADVNQLSSIDSAATSLASITYHAYNMSFEKTTITTRTPEFTTTTNNTTRNLPARVTTVVEDDGRDRGDPLAQTFFIKKGMGKGSNSVFISKIDLFFKRKSDINGVTITLREVQNGYPSGIILPFSKKHLESSDVNISDDATAVTEVFFDAPVRMDIEKEYAVVIMPDANDPNYLHFTSKVGGTDLTTGPTQGQAVVQDWGDGVLFTSTNNRAWQSVQDEDIKFNLYRHEFNAVAGSVTLTNEDHEFFTLSDWTGRFQQEEFVYKETATGYIVSVSQGSNIVTQTGNDFNVDYAAGDYILIENSGATLSDIFKIASVDSSTQMTLTKTCSFNGSNGTGTPIVAGKISHYNKFNRAEMHLKQSSATASKKFSAGDTIYGFTSGVEGTIGTVDNINLSYVQPFVQKANDSISKTTISGYFNDPANSLNNYTMPMRFGDNNAFTNKGVTVYSKSNNLLGTYPFDIIVNMSNGSNSTSTPVVDLDLSALLAYQFKVTDSSATSSRYISKTVELVEDLDAEDMQVTLTGHRPNGTEIKVYIKPQHAQDSAAFDTIDWIELELFEGTNTYTSAVNTEDYREYKYRVAEANKDGSGVIEYTSTEGTFSSYRKFAIKIELLADNIWVVPTVKDYRGIALT